MVAATRTVVVPGFMGSTLSYQGGAGGKTPLWFSPRQLIANGPASLGLAANGTSPGVGGRTLFADGPVHLGVYEPLLTAIANGGGFPSFWGYDWRLDQRTLAASLVTYLEGLAGLDDPFDVVCHSNGGIIAQLAYPLWQALPNPKQTWRMTVYLGTPHGGTYTAAQNLAGLYQDGTYCLLLAAAYNLGAAANPLLSGVANLLAGPLATAVCSWPSLYNLLPNPVGAWAALDGNAGRLLLPATYGTPRSVQAQWLTAATAFQIILQNALAGPRPLEVCLRGTSYSTPLSIGAVLLATSPFAYGYSNDGDAVVTADRGTLPIPGITIQDYDPCSHQDLCRTAAPLAGLVALLQSPPTPPPGSKLTRFADIPQIPYNLPPTFGAVDTGPTVNPFINRVGDP